jgi:hypothetical protein
MDEGGADENFIDEWIEQFSEGGDEIEFAREVAIEPIGGGGYYKCRERDPRGGNARLGCRDDIDDRESESGERDRVRQIHKHKMRGNRAFGNLGLWEIPTPEK